MRSNAGMANRRGRRLALRASLRPQLTLWLGLAWLGLDTDTRDTQGWQNCVVIPLAKHLVGTTGKVQKVKACVVRRQGTEEGRTEVR